jgi:hypothetical protein
MKRQLRSAMPSALVLAVLLLAVSPVVPAHAARSKADQTITFPQPASPATYQSTFTVNPTASSGLPVTVTPSGVCIIVSGNIVVMTSGTGTCTLTASQAGDSTYNPAPNVVRTVTAQKANQTITFPQPTSPATYQSTFTVSATSDSTLSVTITPSGVCTMVGNTVTMTSGTGTCTLTASQGGDINYNAASNVVRTVTAQKADQTITFPAPASPATYHSTFTVSATSDSTLTVTITPSGVCSLVGSTVTMTSGTGTCTLTATQAGNANYNAATPVVRTVTAQKADQTITFPAPASPATYHSTFTVNPSSSSTLAVTVTPTGVCSMNGNTVTITSGTGTCTLTATQAGNDNYNPAPNVVRTVTAQKANQTISFPQPASPAAYLSTFTVNPTSDSGLAVTVTPTGVCTINGNTVTMTSSTGTCTLTANQAGDDNYNAAPNVVRTVIAQKANQTISFPQPASPAAYLSTFTVNPTSDSGLPVTVTPSGVCSMDGNTVSMTSATGTCTLTATQAGDGNYNAAAPVTRTVAAQKANQTITFPQPPSPAAYLSTFTVNPTSDSGLPVNVTAGGVCTILGNTVSMTSGTGICTLTATQDGDASYNYAPPVMRTVTAQKIDQTPLQVTGPASVTYGTTTTITYTGGSGMGAISYSHGSSLGCTVNSSTGLITVVNASLTCLVTVTKAADDNYNMATSAGVVLLNKAAQATLAVTGPANVTYGTTPTITTLGGSGTGALSFSQGSSTGCSVNPTTGVITVIAVSGSCTVTATKAADDNYLVASSAGFDITLHKAPGSVSINNIPADAAYSGSFTPAFTKLGDGTVMVGSLTGSTCTVNSGVVNFIELGTCTLQAVILEGTNYLGATGTPQSFAISKADQTIVFTSTAPASAFVGGTYIPTAEGGASGNPVIFTIDASASQVCSISAGTVSFLAEGICVINANQAGDAHYNAAPQVQQSFSVGELKIIYLPLVFR